MPKQASPASGWSLHRRGKICEGLQIFLEDTAHLADPGNGNALGNSKTTEGVGHPRMPPLRESDEPGRFNIRLIEQIAQACLANDLVAIVEGILDAHRYGAMLARLADGATESLFYSFDLTFEK